MSVYVPICLRHLSLFDCYCTYFVVNKTKEEGGPSLSSSSSSSFMSEWGTLFWKCIAKNDSDNSLKHLRWFPYLRIWQILFSHPKRVEWSVCCCQCSTLSLPDSETFGLNGSNEVCLCWTRYLELWLLERKKKKLASAQALICEGVLHPWI